MIQTSVLENSLVERVIQRIAMAFHPRKIILFGSHAHGKSQTHSDIDLLLIYDGPLSKNDLHLLVLDLFDRPDFSLDVFILNSDEWENLKPVANSLAREAAETGIVCYG